MLSSSLPTLNRWGQILLTPFRGRPRGAETRLVGDADPKDEYTAREGAPAVYGLSTSPLSGVRTEEDFQRLLGNVDDLDITVGWEAKDQMDRDAHCGAALDTVMLGAIARGASVEPAEKSSYQNDGDEEKAIQVAEFVRRATKYLMLSQRDLSMTAFAVGRAAMKVGHANAEVVKRLQRGGVDDRKLVIDRIKLKSRKQSCFVVDRQNNVVGIAAYTGDYTDWVDPYTRTNGGGYLAWSVLAQSGWRILPRDKWLSLTYRPGEDDSPLGNSAYRRAWAPYRMKYDAWALYLKALDLTAMPFLDIEMSQGAPRMYGPTKDGRPDVERGYIDAHQAMYEWAALARQGGILVRPHGSKAQYLHNSQSGDPFAAAISVYNGEITMAILLQMLATGTSKHMARAAGEVHQDILDLAMRYARHLVADSITRDVFGPLVRDNFPVEYWHLVPRCSFGDVELNDFAAWAEAFAKLAREGLILPSQFPHIWATLGLPQADMEDFLEEIGFDDELLRQITAPVINPTTGATEPSMAATHTLQEFSKRLTRSAGSRRASRQGAVVNG